MRPASPRPSRSASRASTTKKSGARSGTGARRSSRGAGGVVDAIAPLAVTLRIVDDAHRLRIVSATGRPDARRGRPSSSEGFGPPTCGDLGAAAVVVAYVLQVPGAAMLGALAGHHLLGGGGGPFPSSSLGIGGAVLVVAGNILEAIGWTVFLRASYRWRELLGIGRPAPAPRAE